METYISQQAPASLEHKPQNSTKVRQLKGIVDNRVEAVNQAKLISTIQRSSSQVAQLMTQEDFDMIMAWWAEKGLSITDYGYKAEKNLIVYRTQTGYDARIVEVHVHLSDDKSGRVEAANVRFHGETTPQFYLVGDERGEKILNECLEYWFPSDPYTNEGADDI